VTEPVVPPSIAGTIGRVVAFVVLMVLCVTIGALMLSPPLTWLAARAGQRLRVDYYGQLAGVAAATWIMLRGVDHRPWADVDLGENAARPRLFGIGWLAGMAAIATTCGLLFISGLLHFVPAIVAGGGWLGAAVRVTLVLLPAALAEEMATRGYLLTVLRERMGARAAVMAHLAWNWVMAVPLHAYVSGQRLEAPGYRAVAAGPEWLSGGRWGPEGGLVAALGLIAGLAYFHARRRREES
jgi:membrane protease YdiL (CAAX protease family)